MTTHELLSSVVEALEPFARLYEAIDCTSGAHQYQDDDYWPGDELRFGDLRRARTVLTAVKAELEQSGDTVAEFRPGVFYNNDLKLTELLLLDAFTVWHPWWPYAGHAVDIGFDIETGELVGIKIWDDVRTPEAVAKARQALEQEKGGGANIPGAGKQMDPGELDMTQPGQPDAGRADYAELVRYGLRWKGHDNAVCEPVADGYWTPWREAADAIARLVQERDELSVRRDAWEDRATRECHRADVLESELAKLKSAPPSSADVRREALEEAARVCDENASSTKIVQPLAMLTIAAYEEGCCDCARAIRSLIPEKEKGDE